MTDGWTDQRTDDGTDGPTKRVVESLSTRLKRQSFAVLARKSQVICMSLNIKKDCKGPGNSDYKSGLAVKSGVVRSSKINITKACKIQGPKKSEML